MSNNYFQFKKFTVYQDKTAMKVGVDSVLLGAYTECKNAKNILDIGTGTGLLALMLAQKTSVPVTAIELEQNAYRQALENIQNSKWNNISVLHSSVQDYAAKGNITFDLIICNPPYFHKSLGTNNLQRNIARHDNELTIDILISCINTLLSDKGRFYMIYPYDRKEEVLNTAAKYKLYPTNLLAVRGNESKPPNRIIIELAFDNSNHQSHANEKLLTVRSKSTNKYTKEYKELTKDYYLNISDD